MKSLNMFLQISWFSEGFSTRITFVISLCFMNCLDVFFQRSWFSEGFSTRITFKISLSFMNCLVVNVQISWLSEWFSTITTVESLTFMNCLDVILKMSWLIKGFSAWITFEFPWALVMIIFEMQSQSNFCPKYSVAYIASKNVCTSMCPSKMFPFSLIWLKCFFTNFTFQIIFYLSSWFHFKRLVSTDLILMNWIYLRYHILSLKKLLLEEATIISFNIQPRIMKWLHIYHLSLLCFFEASWKMRQVALNKLLYAIFIIIQQRNETVNFICLNYQFGKKLDHHINKLPIELCV